MVVIVYLCKDQDRTCNCDYAFLDLNVTAWQRPVDDSKKVDMRIAGVEVDVIVILNLPFQGCGPSMIPQVWSAID